MTNTPAPTGEPTREPTPDGAGNLTPIGGIAPPVAIDDGEDEKGTQEDDAPDSDMNPPVVGDGAGNQDPGRIPSESAEQDENGSHKGIGWVILLPVGLLVVFAIVINVGRRK